MTEEFRKRLWWSYIEEDLQELLRASTLLVERVGEWDEKFHDYAFVVFPAAKAYEGFLKKLFLDMGFISEKEYLGKRFRIGKALNPALRSRHRERISVYDKMVTYCNGKDLANRLWKTWKEGRNLLFHWFPEEKNAISFDEARNIVSMIFDSMDAAFDECKIE